LPYHPDYQEQHESEQYSGTSEGSGDEQYPPKSGALRVRRGSEGYEVRPAEREEILRQYLENLGEEPGRYLRYIPQVEDEGESDLEGEDDDNVPLASHARRVGGQ
jgi:palmitoyltransferase